MIKILKSRVPRIDPVSQGSLKWIGQYIGQTVHTDSVKCTKKHQYEKFV